MYFIKPCPSCGRKLRFPIDRGIINVKCPCGYSFVADPDNTQMYRGGTFDLEEGRKSGKIFEEIKEKIFDISVKKITTLAIESVLQHKYNLQNFHLLSNENRRKVIFKTALVVITVAAIIYFLYWITAPSFVGEQYI